MDQRWPVVSIMTGRLGMFVQSFANIGDLAERPQRANVTRLYILLTLNPISNLHCRDQYAIQREVAIDVEPSG